MTRTYLVTGAASGIGKATKELLEARGGTVIGADLAGSDVNADLSTAEGRATLVREVARRIGGSIDGVIANAGLATPTATTVAVNFYGTVATLEGLRPLLAASAAPRAVVTASMASLFPPDDALLAELLDGTEDGAMARGAELEAGTPEQAGLIYGTTKRALVRWIRRHAATPEWAGAAIALNAIAPGVVLTPMVAQFLATEEQRATLARMVPMPLNGFIEAPDVAELIAWLASEHNAHLCGQVVFIDGGSDVVIRGDSTW